VTRESPGGMTQAWTRLFGDTPVVVDGGLSTQLVRLGQDISGLLWTGRALLEDPGAVARAHADFVRAGADVVISASYQVSRSGFARAGLSEADADAALEASMRVAREAVASVPGSRCRVAASVGPYGAILHDGSEYRGRYGRTRQQLADFHRERLEVLVTTGPDLLAVETIPDVDEAVAVVDALADHPDVPAWLSFSAADGAHVCAGQPIEEAVAVALTAPSVAAVGVNCTDPQHVSELVQRIRSTCDLPIVVYPNAGGRWDAADGEWHGGAAADGAFPDPVVLGWVAAGATAVGGCCGTDAEAVSRIARLLARPAG
jgi:homocysteine S-methyltransferase